MGEQLRRLLQFLGGCPVGHFFKPPQPKTNLAAMSKRKRRQTKRARTATAATGTLNPNTHLDAAGIDIGSAELVAAVPSGRCDTPVRTFFAFTSEEEEGTRGG